MIDNQLRLLGFLLKLVRPLQVIVIGARIDVVIGKDDLPSRLGCRRFNQHRALFDDGFYPLKYYLELCHCRNSHSCPEIRAEEGLRSKMPTFRQMGMESPINAATLMT
jgi:hypothetical protein